jgi:hypothetical protein
MNYRQREESIHGLTDQQAVSIVKYMTDTLQDKVPEDSLPQEEEQLIEALSTLLRKEGYQIDLTSLNKTQELNEDAIGTSAKNLLLFLAKTNDSDLLARLDKWLQNPPVEGKASIESLLTTVPIIIAGSFSLLIVASGIRYKNREWSYDPVRAKELIKDNIAELTKVLDPLIQKVGR